MTVVSTIFRLVILGLVFMLLCFILVVTSVLFDAIYDKHYYNAYENWIRITKIYNSDSEYKDKKRTLQD